MNEHDENLLNYIIDEAGLVLKMTKRYDLHDFLTNEMAQHAICSSMNERDENFLNFMKYEADLVLKMTERYDLHDFLANEMAQHTVCMDLANIC